ncbi:LysR family transcriptional regulator [Aeromicrobium terrae]|nr:LysR family transcriptional regulator [Aeromicrobium terrae]
MRVERARYFLAAVETGSLRAAAARCGISQPAIGQQIVLLEEELDVVLLTRSRTGVRPTPAGQALIEPLTRLVTAEDGVLDAATESGGAYQGRVAIGAVSAAAEIVIAPIVGLLRKDHAGLRFFVSEASSTEIEAAVATGDLDLGVVSEPAGPPPTSVSRIHLFSSSVGIVVRVDHLLAERDSVAWKDLETWPIVTLREGTVLWGRLHDALPAADVVVQSASARSVRLMVAQGAGIGIVGSAGHPDDDAGLRWIPIRDAEPLRLCLVQRSDTRPSRSALTVRRLITEQAEGLDVDGVAARPASRAAD